MNDDPSVRAPDPHTPTVSLSNRHRWSVCPASAVLPQVRTPSGPSAQEGTAAHTVAEWAVQRAFQSANVADVAPTVEPPPGLDGFDYSAAGLAAWRADVATFAQTYAKAARALTGPGQAFAMPELKFNRFERHGVTVLGVADLVAWNSASKHAVIGDYKFGRSPVGCGTASDPNEQVAAAAVLFDAQFANLGAQSFSLFVYQPRIRYGEAWQEIRGLDRAWLDAQTAKLDAELAAVALAADAVALGDTPTAVPGEQCKYCPSARFCPASATYGATALAVDAGRRAVVDLTASEVMALWSQRAAFKQFEDDLRERVRFLHEIGDPAVTTRRRAGATMWVNPVAAAEALMLADRYDLLQPPSVDKARAALGAQVDALTTRAPDVLTFVSTDGKQPERAANAFAKYLPNNA